MVPNATATRLCRIIMAWHRMVILVATCLALVSSKHFRWGARHPADTRCPGNAGETCGGPNRLNVYAAGGEWVQLGCFTDQPYSRTLSYVASYSGDLTVEKCLASCSAAGFPYSGVEYGDEVSQRRNVSERARLSTDTVSLRILFRQWRRACA